MARKFGTVTSAIADALRHAFRKDGSLEVFNDPKQKRKRMERIPRVYSGARFDENAVLSCFDVAVLRNKDCLALARVFEGVDTEISEVLGVVSSVLLSDKLRVDGRSFSFKNTRLVVAIATSGRGVGQGQYSKLEKKLAAQLQAIQAAGHAKGIAEVRLAVATAAGIENLLKEGLGEA